MKNWICGALVTALTATAQGAGAPSSDQAAEMRRSAIAYLAWQQEMESPNSRSAGAAISAHGTEARRFLYSASGAIDASRTLGVVCLPSKTTYGHAVTKIAESVIGDTALQADSIGAAATIMALKLWPCSVGKPN